MYGVVLTVDLDLKSRHGEFSFEHQSSAAEPCGGTSRSHPRPAAQISPKVLHLAGALSFISTVAVIPAERMMSGGPSSIWIRTGMRWASRTQVKIGFTVATP